MDIIDCFSHLQLHLLGEEWVQQVWDSDFTELEELPSEYEEFVMENDILSILETTVKCLRESLKNVPEESEYGESSNSVCLSWEFLIENKLEHKHLLSLLAYFIAHGQDKASDKKSLELCFNACSFYYLLLAIPGCDAFFVYQPSVYEKALKTFNIMRLLNEIKQSKPKGRKKVSNNENEEEMEEFGENEDVEEALFSSLNAQAKTHIRKCLNTILNDQFLMMKRYPLKVEDALGKTIIQLVSHTHLSSSSTALHFETLKINGDVSSFVCNSYCLLKALCVPLHGQIKETTRLMFHTLLHNILMTGDFAKDLTAQNLNLIRLQTENFILYLLKSLGEVTYEGLCILVQHLCTRVVDRADYRLKVSQSIVTFLKALPSEPYFLLIKWLLRFAHDSKASHRLFALEVISKLLYEEERSNDALAKRYSIASEGNSSPVPERDDFEIENQDILLNNGNVSQQAEKDVASHKYLLGVLFSRCHDQSSTVRAKAISTLADCVLSSNKVLAELMKEIFVTPYENNDLIQNDAIIERGFLNTKIFLDSLDKPQHLQADPLPGGKGVVNEMLKLSKDEKVFVRKSAFTFLESLMKLNYKWKTHKLLKAMSDHVRDPALLIKKQLIQTLSELVLMYPEDETLGNYFVEAVLPQISHPEVKVQEKVLNVLQATLIHKMVPFNQLRSPLSYLPWKLLESVILLKKQKFLKIICSQWARTTTLPNNIISMLETHIYTPNNEAAWLLLSCIAPYVKVSKPGFVIEYIRKYIETQEQKERYAVVKALDVLGSVWKNLPKSDQESICLEFLDLIEHMHLCITFIGPVINVAYLITMGQASSVVEGQNKVKEWAKHILEILDTFFGQNSPLNKEKRTGNAEEFMRHLVTLGDIAQLLPGNVPGNIAIALAGILFPEKLHDPGRWSVPGLQALTIITLGKMCLQNECLAKRIVPAIGLLLSETRDESVKVNVLNTLSDMCIRFTAVVEPILSEMCVCLKDSNSKVRHHTMTVFVRLLQQDFLKLRGALLFHMMSMLLDQDQNIAQLADYFMIQSVVSRYKSIMYQNIVESIFYFNKYDTHPSYSKIKLSAQESHLFDLSGAANETKRQTLYRFMCEHMTDEQRMQTTHKICVDILGGVSNETIVLDAKGESVLRDAFFILSCEEICLHSLRGQSEDDPATDDVERVTAAVNTAKKNIISQCVKQQVVEIIIPIIVQLKAKLQAIMSPLLNYLMNYLRNILKDYKNEIEEIFSEDKTMAEELLYDMKKFEEEEKRQSNSQESDDEGGEEDPMRPILVQIATDHLRQTIGIPVSEAEKQTDSRKSASNSPPDKNNEEICKKPEESSLEDLEMNGQSTQRTRQASAGVRSRSCTPTSRPSRNSQKRSHNHSQNPTDTPSSSVSRRRDPEPIPGCSKDLDIGGDTQRRLSKRRSRTSSSSSDETVGDARSEKRLSLGELAEDDQSSPQLRQTESGDIIKARSCTPTSRPCSRNSQKHNVNGISNCQGATNIPSSSGSSDPEPVPGCSKDLDNEVVAPRSSMLIRSVSSSEQTTISSRRRQLESDNEDEVGKRSKSTVSNDDDFLPNSKANLCDNDAVVKGKNNKINLDTPSRNKDCPKKYKGAKKDNKGGKK